MIDLPRNYIDVNLPKEWKPFLDEALANKRVNAQIVNRGYTETHSGLGKWIIWEYLIEHTSFRFIHINTNDRQITIQDRRTGTIFDVHIREPQQLWCEVCDKTDCEHVHHVFTIEEVRTVLHRKGWELPDV